MRKDRLLKLAAHLRTVDPEKFIMHSWICGTKACALGHAAMIPEFQKAGLLLTILSKENGRITYRGRAGFYAAAAFFEISFTNSKDIFGYGGFLGITYKVNPSPSEIADVIEEVIAKHHEVNRS